LKDLQANIDVIGWFGLSVTRQHRRRLREAD